ncbi:MAG: vWA domain-containing protein, partial [Planctomycetia bacterium]
DFGGRSWSVSWLKLKREWVRNELSGDGGGGLVDEQAADERVAGDAPMPGPGGPAPRGAVAPAGSGLAGLERSARVDKAQPAREARDAAGIDRLENLSVERAKDAAPAPLGRESGPASGERYEGLPENRFQPVREQPLSTLSIDVDTASYANVRRFLTSGRLPPPEAVRLEELINYFPYDYPQPDGDRPFSVTLEAAACPWRPGHRLVRIGLEGRDVDRRERPAGNLVFLVDVSGSMSDADKLPLVKQSLSMLVDELTENDRVAIVTYAGQAGLALPSTSGDQKQRIRTAIDALAAGGSTHGSAGIALAYEQAAANFVRGGVNRVILATDGDLNVGVTSDEALVDLITEKARGGTFLTVLGFGTGNLQDTKMEKIADHGNGIYAYIDGVREARKVLVEQLTGSTITIAKDVKIQVEFNPAIVASYRLLGYENRMLAAQDFRDDRKDAGEIGAGHRVTALYEVELVGEGGPGSPGTEPLKYQPRSEPAAPASAPVDAATSRELLTVKLRWKRPDGDTSQLDEVPLSDRGGAFETASEDLRFAAAVAGFGMILRGSGSKGDATLPLVARIAGSALGEDVGGYRAEFLDLVRRAESLRDGGQSPR